MILSAVLLPFISSAFFQNVSVKYHVCMLLLFSQLFFDTRKKIWSEGIVLEVIQVIHHDIHCRDIRFLQHKRIKNFARNCTFVQRKTYTVLRKKLSLVMLIYRQDTCTIKGNRITQNLTVLSVPFIKDILRALLMRICSAQFFWVAFTSILAYFLDLEAALCSSEILSEE